MQLFLWIKALHLISMVAWMAGMLYLPRLYVYHSGTPVRSAASETFKLMESRLLRIITNPAMIATWGFGLALIWIGGGGTLEGMKDWMAMAGWFHAKLALVLGMMAMHIFLARTRRKFARDERPYSAKTFRILNEVPTILMMGIIMLAVVKPF